MPDAWHIDSAVFPPGIDWDIRIGIDEGLWELLAPGEPLAVAFDDLD